MVLVFAPLSASRGPVLACVVRSERHRGDRFCSTAIRADRMAIAAGQSPPVGPDRQVGMVFTRDAGRAQVRTVAGPRPHAGSAAGSPQRPQCAVQRRAGAPCARLGPGSLNSGFTPARARCALSIWPATGRGGAVGLRPAAARREIYNSNYERRGSRTRTISGARSADRASMHSGREIDRQYRAPSGRYKNAVARNYDECQPRSTSRADARERIRQLPAAVFTSSSV